MAPTPFEYPIYLWQLISGFRSQHEQMFARLRDRDTAGFLSSNEPLRILDLGNGRLRPQYVLLKKSGHQVYGIDLANRSESSVKNFLYEIARCLYCWRCAVDLEVLRYQNLICGDVAQLPIRSESFDIITSIAAFEHFLDVPAVLKELARILRPRGVLWICIHLFTCPSGAHNVTFTQIPLRKIQRNIVPWDHLRRRELPIDVPLNKWRLQQYLDEFAKRFEILCHYCAMSEGSEFLTPQIKAELTDYSVDELTCHAYIIVARKNA